MKRKWVATTLVSLFTFISPVSSTFVAPALANIGADLGITSEVVLQLCLSIFVLAYALGPLVIGPLSEIYGRKILLQLTNLWYIVFNIACGVAQTPGQMIAFRFLAGLGGSAPMAVSKIPLDTKKRVIDDNRLAAQLWGTASVQSNEGKPWLSTV